MNSLSPKSKYILLSFILFVVMVFLMIFAVETGSKLLAAIFLMLVAIGGYLMHNVRCPNCEQSLTKQVKFMSIPFNPSNISNICKSCSCDLSKPPR